MSVDSRNVNITISPVDKKVLLLLTKGMSISKISELLSKKPSEVEDCLDSIHQKLMYSGEAKKLIDLDNQNPSSAFSDDEMVILCLIDKNLSNEKIGQFLSIDESEAKSRILEIYEKLDVRSRFDALHVAYKNEILNKDMVDSIIARFEKRFKCIANSHCMSLVAAPQPQPSVILEGNEMKILKLFAEGVGNPEICDRLGIRCVELNDSMDSMFQKLSVLNRKSAVEKAYEIGLL